MDRSIFEPPDQRATPLTLAARGISYLWLYRTPEVLLNCVIPTLLHHESCLNGINHPITLTELHWRASLRRHCGMRTASLQTHLRGLKIPFSTTRIAPRRHTLRQASYRTMSSFTLKQHNIPVTLPEGLKEEQLLSFHPFDVWRGRLAAL